MSSLLELPIEILAIIVQKLDTKSLYNLHDTCSYFRGVIGMPGVVKECQFSMNTLAAAKSLHSEFFRAIASHLRILNLSGVEDLTKSALVPILRRLKNLLELDVSYTKIMMPDSLDILKVCGKIGSLSINFAFFKKYKLTKDVIAEYQIAYAGLKKVHFVGSITDLLYFNTAVRLVDKSNLNSLKLTISKKDYVNSYQEEHGWKSEVVNKLSLINVFIWEIVSESLFDLPIFKLLDLSKFEILVCNKHMKTLVHATTTLNRFISECFQINVLSLSNLSSIIVGETGVFMWHKDNTKFDDKFYNNIMMILQEYLEFTIDPSNLAPVPSRFNWYFIEQSCPPVRRNNDEPSQFVSFKKRRLSQPTLTLNYDNAFIDRGDGTIQLEIKFVEPLYRPVTIKNGLTLKKLKKLSLWGNVHYTEEFFNNLFEECNYLSTLQIIKFKGSFCVQTLLSNLPKCKSLKNFFLHTGSIHYIALFNYLSQIPALENVRLVNNSSSTNSLPEPNDLFINCKNLYSLCIQCDISERKEILQMYKKVRSKLGRNGLYIEISSYIMEGRHGQYNPYFNVFNIYKFKPTGVGVPIYLYF